MYRKLQPFSYEDSAHESRLLWFLSCHAQDVSKALEISGFRVLSCYDCDYNMLRASMVRCRMFTSLGPAWSGLKHRNRFNYAGSKNHSPHLLRKRSHFGEDCSTAAWHTKEHLERNTSMQAGRGTHSRFVCVCVCVCVCV
jgi:hypothetical protein